MSDKLLFYASFVVLQMKEEWVRMRGGVTAQMLPSKMGLSPVPKTEKNKIIISSRANFIYFLVVLIHDSSCKTNVASASGTRDFYVNSLEIRF
jgi:hypothetical protein